MVAAVTKKSLPTVAEDPQPLGRDTIMDPILAGMHGVPYVHLACFAIDVDRIRELVEDDPDSVWPFGWEVFLTEVYLLTALEPEDEAVGSLVEDLCLAILDAPADEEPALGGQVPFAVYDAIARGEWPESYLALFDRWKGNADSLVSELAPLWEEPEVEAADLALACLELELEPPLAPPTRLALEAMVAALVEP